MMGSPVGYVNHTALSEKLVYSITTHRYLDSLVDGP